MSLLSVTVSIADAAILAALGEGIVFVGLIALMIVVILVGKAFTAKKAKKTEEAAPAPVVEAAPVVVEDTRKKLGDLAKTDEDVLSYIAFPNLAEKFLEERKAKEENVATYSIVEA